LGVGKGILIGTDSVIDPHEESMKSLPEPSVELADSPENWTRLRADTRQRAQLAAGFSLDEGCSPLNCNTCFGDTCRPRQDASELFSEVF